MMSKDTENKKVYSYGQIVAVGRKLRRYENVLNNAEQFRSALDFEFHNSDLLINIDNVIEFVLKEVAKYRKIYDNMLNSIC